MVTLDGPKQIWMIKVEGEIKGPFTDLELANMLLTKSVTAQDEVTAPFSSWRSFQKTPYFAEALLKIKQGKSVTSTDFGKISQENMDWKSEVEVETLKEKEPAPPKEKPAEIVYETIEEVSTGSRKAAESNPMYTTRKDRSLYAEASTFQRNLWVGIGILIAGGIGYGIVQRQSNLKIGKEQSQVLIERAERQFRAAAFEESFNSFKEAFGNDTPKHTQLKFYLPLLIQSTPDLDGARKRVKEGAEILTPSESANLIGMLDAMESNFKGAAENFTRAKSLDDKNIAADLNLASVQYANGAKEEAFATLDFLIQRVERAPKVGEDPFVYLLAINLSLENLRNSESNSDIDKTLNRLDGYLKSAEKRTQLIGSELELVRNVLRLKRRTLSLSSEQLASWLDSDPKMFGDLVRSPYYWNRYLGWDEMLQWCREVFKSVSDSALGKTAISACLYKSKKIADANYALESAQSQEPKNPLVLSWVSTVLNSQDLGSRANVASEKAIEYNSSHQYAIPLIEKARNCEKREEWMCAEETWKKLTEMNPDLPSAKAGLARALIKNGGITRAKAIIISGQRKLNFYGPFRHLDLEMESK